MDKNKPTNELLLSLTLSAMLTSAFISTAPDGMISAAAIPAAPAQAIAHALDGLKGFGGPGADIAPPGDAPAPAATHEAEPRSPLNKIQLERILAAINQRGTEENLKPTLAELLGLAKSGNDSPVGYAGIAISKNDVVCGFAKLDDGRGYILDKGVLNKDGIILHIDADLKLIAAAPKNGAPAPSRAEAEETLRQLLTLWAAYADARLGTNVSKAGGEQGPAGTRP